MARAIELREAIAHGEFGIVYQPLVCASARRVERRDAGALTSPTMGEVEPDVLARALDIAAAAEVVETPGQADVMRVVGCDQMQGWLFAHAVSASEIDSRFGDAAQAA